MAVAATSRARSGSRGASSPSRRHKASTGVVRLARVGAAWQVAGHEDDA
jgi:hypothetical protein